MTHITKMYPHLTKLSTLMIKTISRNGIGKSAYLTIQTQNLLVALKEVVNTPRNRWIRHQSNAEIQNKAWINKNYFLKLDHPSRNSYSQSFFSKLLLNWDIVDEKTTNKKNFLKLDHSSRNSYSQSFHQQTFTFLRFC